MKNKSSKKIEYIVGFLLLSIYIFTTYVAVDIIIPKRANSLTLYVFLAWGLLTLLLYGIRTKIPVYSAWYLVFMFVSLLTMLYSPETRIVSGEFYLLIVGFFITYFVPLFINDENDFRKLCWVYAISSFTMVLMLQFTGNLVGSAEERLGGELLDNTNNFALVIMIATLFELWLLVYGSKSFWSKIALSVMVVYNMYALALAAGRKFLLLPFLFLYILLLCKKNKKGKRNIVLYTVIAAIMAGVAFTMIMKIPVLYNAIGTRLEASIDKTDTKSEAYWSSKVRRDMRNDALQQWSKKPLLGYGFDSYKYRAREVVGHFFYSHCNYVELLYNGGILYFAVYYWFFYKMAKDLLKKKTIKNKLEALGIAVLLCIVVLDYGMVSYSVASINLVVAIAMKTTTFEYDTENDSCLEENKNEQIKNIN